MKRRKHTDNDLACWIRDKGHCQECGVRTDYALPPYFDTSFHMRRIKPRCGNLDTVTNAETICGSCSRKSHT